MKGIVLGGGRGTRLKPITDIYNKHLIPIYKIPMIYYPISTLMMLGVTEFLITCHKRDIDSYKKLLGSGEKYGITIDFIIQEEAGGIAEALILADGFINKGERFLMILGDNFFSIPSIKNFRADFLNIEHGAKIVTYEVQDAKAFGVASINSNGDVLKLEEKPEKPESNLAVTGLYNYDYSAIEFAKKSTYSDRNELEITDINIKYLEESKLQCTQLKRSAFWFDCGTFSDILKVSSFLELMENIHDYKIGILEEIALDKKYINLDQYNEILNSMPKSEYKEYLERVLVRYKKTNI